MLWSGVGTLPSAYGQPESEYETPESGACDRHKRLRKEALQKMRKTPVFTKERREYERQANLHASRYRMCMRGGRREKRSGAKFQMPKELTTPPKPPKPPKQLPPEEGEPPRIETAALPPSAAVAGRPPVGALVGGALALALLAFFALRKRPAGA